MKTPVYEASPGALLALLTPPRGTPRKFVRADLYTIALAAGTSLYYAAGSRSITYPGAPGTWAARTVGIDVPGNRATGHWKIGLDVDTWQVSLTPRAVDPLTGAAYPDKIGITPWLAAAAAGALDGAIVTVDRAYFADWPPPMPQAIVPVGVYRIFVGRVAQVDVARTSAMVSVASLLEYMTIQMPRNLFQAPCSHTLFDAGCQLSAASFVVHGSVLSGSTALAIKTAAGSPGGSGTYVLGRVAFTSGANAGIQRMAVGWDAVGGVITLRNALPFPPVAGDTFDAYPGCNLSKAACAAFGNSDNFGGEPDIPQAESAI